MNKYFRRCESMEELTHFEEQLRAWGYKHHHMGSRRGYVSRKIGGIVEEYSGKFGEGYAIILPRWDTTNYVYVQYWTKETSNDR